MRIILLAILIGFTCAVACAKEYGSYDPKRLLTVSETPMGKKYGFDGNYLEVMLNDLASHALNYPPRFDTPQDLQRAFKDVSALTGMLEVMVNDPNANPEMLLRAGMLNSIGHNLDIPGATGKAISIFQRLLVVSPSHPRGNYLYGMFLAGAGKPTEAIPYLEKALSTGVVDASYALGMTYLTLNDKQRALENLENYQKSKPGDTNVTMLVESIREGKLELKRNVLEIRTLTEADHGAYAIVDIKGQVTNKVFRFSQRNSEWIIEDRRPDGSWVPVTCATDCKLSASSEVDVQRFFNASTLAEITPTCVHNKSLAFCAYSMKKGPAFRGYAFVGLTEKGPVALKLVRVSPDKAVVPNPAVRTDAAR